MSGVKGRSGRKRITVNSENGKAKLDTLLPLAISVIEEALEEGDKDISKWVIEMRLGKPRQQVEAGIHASELRVDADMIARLHDELEAGFRRKLGMAGETKTLMPGNRQGPTDTGGALL